MIPKTIHICWFSGEEYTPFIKECMATWKVHLPDFKIRIWNKDSFDFDSVPFVKEAFEAKKWAFAADYIRLYALYTEGGLYLDSDVKILKPFKERWFEYDFFSAHEIHPGLFENAGGMKQLNSSYLPVNGESITGFAVQGAIFASVPNHPYVKDCLDQYTDLQLFGDDGTMNLKKVIIGSVITPVAEKYGYTYQNKEQILKENMLILPANILVGNSIYLDRHSYAIHLINGSWRGKKGIEKFLHLVRNHYPRLFPVVNFIDKSFKKTYRTSKYLKTIITKN
ncbi:glycosyltransferase family 32 protein [Flavobacterium defluvii]|uniref:Capsular polysaccharide synthesis protein n=1 Tax=Flavobacterium defluvii TaxID=370979 RepID=A0A1M5PQS6_9FLAO|nr:glycosyltransferase [Flavobacterium defluvii]SHH03966.1 Capsular polysaccharide synthesis protein [Flavobacterium defluvii]